MTRTPFVAVALFAPAAFAATDLHGSAGAPAHVRAALSAPAHARIATDARAEARRVRSQLPETARVTSLPRVARFVRAPRAPALPSVAVLEARDIHAAARAAGRAALAKALTQTVPGTVARILADGYAAAPRAAPAPVKEATWAANSVIGLPYLYGGGHGGFYSDGYDCSGTVSFALHGGGLLSAPMDSSEFFTYGVAGRGRWVTVYTNPTHAFVEIAGIRLDTSSAGQADGNQGPRWRPLLANPSGYTARHPRGF